MRPIIKILFRLSCGVALCALLPYSTWAQEIRPLAVTDIGGELGLEFLYEDETAKGENADTEIEETIYRETVGLWTKGYIYHPNLLDFRVGLDLGLKQQDTDGVSDDSQLTGYDIDLDVLRSRIYGFDAHASKTQAISKSDFGPNRVVDVTEYELGWSTKDFSVPTSVSFSSMTQEETGFSDRTEEQQRIQIDSSHRAGEFSRTNFHYDLLDYSTENINLTTHDVRLSNILRLGDGGKNNLLSDANYSLDEQEQSRVEQMGFSTNFMWQHTPKLSTSYGFGISRSLMEGSEAESIETLNHNEDIRLQHLLYENLTTTVFARNNETESDTFNGQLYGGGIGLGYSRRVPFGKVSANVGYSWERNTQESSGLIPVFDESHILLDGTFVFLDNINVDLSSILITDTSGIPFEGTTDYLVVPVGNRVRIDRVTVGGNIANGQEILVDYLFMSDGNLVYDTTGVSAGSGVDIALIPLSILYSYSTTAHDVKDGDIEESALEDLTIHRIDTFHSRVLPLGGDYSVSFFYENRDSTFSPAETYGLSAGYGRSVLRNSRVNFSSSYTTSTFPASNDETDALTFLAMMTSRLNSSMHLLLKGQYRDLGGTTLDEQAINLSARLDVVVRLLKLSLELSHEEISGAVQDKERNQIFLKMSRSF